MKRKISRDDVTWILIAVSIITGKLAKRLLEEQKGQKNE